MSPGRGGHLNVLSMRTSVSAVPPGDDDQSHPGPLHARKGRRTERDGLAFQESIWATKMPITTETAVILMSPFFAAIPFCLKLCLKPNSWPPVHESFQKIPFQQEREEKSSSFSLLF